MFFLHFILPHMEGERRVKKKKGPMKQTEKKRQTVRKINHKDCLERERLSVKLNQWWAQFFFSLYQHGGMENQTKGKYFWSRSSDLWPSQPLWQDQKSAGFLPAEHHRRPNHSYLGKNKTCLCFSENSVWHQAQQKLLRFSWLAEVQLRWKGDIRLLWVASDHTPSSWFHLGQH